MAAKKQIYRAGVVLLISLALCLWQFKLISLAFYWASMKSGAGEWQTTGVWLPAYRVTVEGLPVEGIVRNASGLTYSTASDTLFSVINAPPQIVELGTDGRLLRRIDLVGAQDPEGITHVRDDLFVIADERDHQLYVVNIDPSTETVDLRDAARLGLRLDLSRNLGFEGVSWDSANERLFVSKEKAPLRVLAISGLPGLLNGTHFDLQIEDWKSPRASSLFMTDLSSLTYHEPTGNLLLLSDESALVVEYSPDGTPVSMMPMWRGWHGLSRRVPQAEGLALGPDGTIYLLSEPNLFYRFERDTPAAWVDAPSRLSCRDGGSPEEDAPSPRVQDIRPQAIYTGKFQRHDKPPIAGKSI